MSNTLSMFANGDEKHRTLGNRHFAKVIDGKLCLCRTVATGVVGPDGKMTYKDQVISTDSYNAMNAFTDHEFLSIDQAVTRAAARPESIVNWALGKTVCRRVIDGMKVMVHRYNIERKYKGVVRRTMKLEDDGSGATLEYDREGVPLPFHFHDFDTNIREDAAASRSSGNDTVAEKAALASKLVAEAQDWTFVNGYGSGVIGEGYQYDGFKAFGFRDVPTNLTLDTGFNWNLSHADRAAAIYENIVAAVKMLVKANIPGPYTLVVPDIYRFVFADDYFLSPLTGQSQSLLNKILEPPRPGVPSVLNINEVYFNAHFDTTFAGADNVNATEAYLMSFSPEYFNALRTLAPTTFTIDLKGPITTKHRVASGFTPLFRRNGAGEVKGTGDYGIVRIKGTGVLP